MRNLLPVLLLPLVSQAFAPPRRHTFSSRTDLEAKKKPFAPDYFDVYDDENDLHIPNRLAFTTAKWQDIDDAQEAFNMLVEAGISFVSCTPGKEKMLGRLIREQDLAVTVAASYNARFKFGGESSVVSAMESIVDALDVNQVDILQVRPSKLSTIGLGALAEGIRSSVDEGYCSSGGAIDITNKGALKSLCRKLEQRDEALLTNQFEFSLVNRKHESMIDSCRSWVSSP
ncbi:Aldo/keto reductase-like protein [Fragilaria crotonensis]|nr:Aldo/keto reductase-like protein [Fragilaria crotonensis]